MNVYVSASGGTAKNATVTLSSSQVKVVCDGSGKRTYTYSELSSQRLVAITVSVPSSVTKGTVKVSAHLDASGGTVAKDASRSFTVTKPKTTSSSSSSGSSSSGSSGSSGAGGTSLPSGGLTPPSTGTGSTTTDNGTSAVLPAIPQQTPTTAPDPAVLPTGSSQAMRGSTEASDELTFDKLASTQAAWLAALLVAFSLLLTQVRLGKASARDNRAKGTHRKTRRRAGRSRRAH
jgi:hypothetical protein